MSCQHDCGKPPIFPRTTYNRPGLDALDYRIGMYDELRRYMLDRIDKRPELAGWTHRGPDDPAIALLESGAIAADIVTFYQQLYANEAFLRTARWRESIFDLVRLLGYRPAPGVGGVATFAAMVSGDAPIEIPKGFGFKAKLEGADDEADFESTAAVTAYPHLSEFHLYRPRLPEQNVTPSAAGNRLELKAVNGQTHANALASVEINPGDRILLAPPAAMFDITGTPYTAQQRSEILVVAEVERLLDRVVLTFETPVTRSRGANVDAYVIGRTFRHFGHDAPPLTTMLSGNPQVATHQPTRYLRKIWGDDNPSSVETNYYSRIPRNDVPLDREVNDLSAGGRLICEGRMTFRNQSAEVPFVVVRKVEEVRSDSLAWGNKSGPSTILLLDKRIIANTSILDEIADIRKLRFHEALGPRLTLRAPTRWSAGAFTDVRLNYFGTRSQARALPGRTLLLSGPTGVQEVKIQANIPGLNTGSADTPPRMWEIRLDREPKFPQSQFDEANPAVTVYGNLVPATQGKTQKETVLGNGDNRREFQTFALPKPPLTYLLDPEASPPQTPQLEIHVAGVRWTRVETLFGAGPASQVYVVREDEDGTSWVQFGDGVMGSRLPSGRGNVVAVYRNGSGAAGPAEKNPQPAERLAGLDEAVLPSPVAGGAEPENETNARQAAPGRMQSLGRLVSLADFESEARTIPGVVKVRAYWTALEGIPQIQLVILTESGTEADLDYVRDIVDAYNRCKGPSRHPVSVIAGWRRWLHIALTVGYDPARRPAAVESAIRDALGVTTSGLFSLENRTFGESAHLSQVLGRVQQVEGVRWVKADSARPIPQGSPPETDPAKIPIPPVRQVLKTLACDAETILALYGGHLELNLAADDTQEACS